MLITQFRYFISIVAGLILMCITSNWVNCSPRVNRALSTLRCEPPKLRNGITNLKKKRKMVKFDCLKGYQLLGSRYAACVNGKWDAPIPFCAKRGCPKLEPPPSGFFIEERKGLMLHLFCKDTHQTAGNRVAQCNGEMWDRELGTCRETSKKPQTWCDFETDDLCRWSHDDTGDFEWKRITSFQANIIHTGPRYDNTHKKPGIGHYMLLESTGIFDDDRARLISPLYEPEESDNACFAFNYYMYGATVGTIRVYVKPLSVDMETIMTDSRYLFFNITGNQHNIWHNTTFNIDQYNEQFQIIIEGTSRNGRLSDIAIDDVAIFHGTHCAKEEQQQLDSTTKEPENNEGEFETIFDYQSCKLRCDETNAPEQYIDKNLTVGIVKSCACHMQCEETKVCCPDYFSVCVFGASDSTDTESVTYENANTKSISGLTTTELTQRHTQQSTTSSNLTTTLLPFKRLPSIETTQPVATTERQTTIIYVIGVTAQTATIRATTRRSTIESTSPATTTSTSTTILPTTTIQNPQDSSRTEKRIFTTSFQMEQSTTSKTIMMHDDPAVTSGHNIHPAQKYFKDSTTDNKTTEESDPAPLPIIVIITSLICIGTILVGVVFGIKYYYVNYSPENYKKNADLANRRKGGTGELDDCSDVLYLTEQIDFTMQTTQQS